MNVEPQPIAPASTAPGPPARLDVGKLLVGRYLVQRRISTNEIGELYLCMDRQRVRKVTLRTLHPELVSKATKECSAFFARIKAFQEKSLPGVVQIYDIIEIDGLSAVVHQYIEGPTLHDYCENYGVLPLDLSASLCRDIALTLMGLHKAKLPHGNITPDSIYLEQRGEQLVPILKDLADTVWLPQLLALRERVAPYSAPELLPGIPSTLGDVFALGAVLFESLTGEHLGSEEPALRSHNPEVSEELDGLLIQMVAPDPELRFQSMSAIQNALNSISIEGKEGSGKRPEKPEIGDVIAEQYVVEGMLGEGGMARVYLSKDKLLGTRVAVKLLNATCLSEPDVVERFIEEASIQARLVHPEPHPNIVAVHRVLRGTPIGFVMEFVPGTTLDEYIGDDSLTLADWIELFAQMCAGLDHAHKNRIIHRDIKPSNILVAQTEDDRRIAKLMDFGISKQLDQPKTRTNLILGTLGYLSPELFASARDASIQSDLYAIGCCMFECITGQLPFPVEGGLRQLAFRVYNEDPPRPTDFGAEIPLSLEALIMMCLSKKKEKRPKTSIWLHDRLRAILNESDDPELKAVIKTSGLQKSGFFSASFGTANTLRNYVSNDELNIARSKGISTGNHSFIGDASTLGVANAQEAEQGSQKKGVFIVIAALLLLGIGALVWIATDTPTPPAPTPPVVDEAPSELVIANNLVISASDLLMKAEEAAAKGDDKVALSLLQEAISAIENPEASAAEKEKLHTFYTRAAQLSEKSGDLDRASKTYEKAAKATNDKTFLLKKAGVDTRRGKYKEAAASLKAADQQIQKDQTLRAEAEALKVRLREHANDLLEKAEKEALSNPENARKMISSAKDLFEQVTPEDESARASFLQNLGAAAEASNDLEGASSAYQDVSELNESFASRWKQVTLAWKRNRITEALSAWEKAKSLVATPEERALVRNMGHQLYAKMADSSEAKGELDNALKHSLVALKYTDDSTQMAPLQHRILQAHLSASEQARTENDPFNALASLRKARPYANDPSTQKSIDQQIKDLERALKSRGKSGHTKTTSSPLPENQIQVWIESLPEEATVYLGRKRLGKTPFIGRFPKGTEPITLLLKKKGRFNRSLQIDAAKGGHFTARLGYRPPKID